MLHNYTEHRYITLTDYTVDGQSYNKITVHTKEKIDKKLTIFLKTPLLNTKIPICYTPIISNKLLFLNQTGRTIRIIINYKLFID